MTHTGRDRASMQADDASSVFTQTRLFERGISPRGGFSGASRGDARVQHVNDWHNNGNTPGIICTRSYFCGQTGFSTRGGFRERASSLPRDDPWFFRSTAVSIHSPPISSIASRWRVEHCPRENYVLPSLSVVSNIPGFERRVTIQTTVLVTVFRQFQCKCDAAFTVRRIKDTDVPRSTRVSDGKTS